MDNSIQIYAQNPRYWQYKGNPTLLLGGTDDDNVFNWPNREQVAAHLDLLASVGGNFDRCVMSARDEGNVKPFKRLDNGKYDLNQWEPEYWERLDFYLDACEKRDIIAQIEVWATYDVSNENSPFIPANTVNQEQLATSKLAFHEDDRKKTRRTFYSSVPALDNDLALLQVQQRFVDKLLEHTLHRPNVLYCVDNEYNFDMPLEWYRYWAEYMQQKASEAGKTIHITQMNQIDWAVLGKTRSGEPLSEEDKRRLGGDWSYVFTVNHREVYDHPEIYSYIDAGNGMGNSSPTEHWDNLVEIWNYIADKPRPINHDKLYGANYGRIWTTREGINKFWRNLIGGSAAMRFHRPSTGLGLSELAQASIAAARKFAELVKPWECVPRMDLIVDKGEHQVYVMAREPEVYGVYIPGNVSGDVWVKIGSPPHRGYTVKWINVSTGEWGEEVNDIQAERGMILSPRPFESGYGWAAVILKE